MVDKSEMKPNEQGNLHLRCGSVAIDSENNLVIGTRSHHLIAMVGIKDCIIIHSDNFTLITPKDRVHEIRNFISRMSGGPGHEDFHEITFALLEHLSYQAQKPEPEKPTQVAEPPKTKKKKKKQGGRLATGALG